MLHYFLNTENEDSIIYQLHTIIPKDEIVINEVDEDIGPEAARVAGNEWRD